MAKMKIKFSVPTIRKPDLKSVLTTLVKDNLIQGELTEKFEEKVSNYFNVKGAVALSNGTMALIAALKSIGIEERNKVIIPSYAPVAYMNALNYLNAGSYLVDSTANSFFIDIDKVYKVIDEEDIRAMIIPHLFGIPGDIQKLVDTGIPVIEDISHSFGSKIEDRFTGTFGKLAVSSLNYEMVITTGQGGLCLSDDPSLLKSIKKYRDFDGEEYSPHLNCKFSDYNAALGISQIKELDEMLDRRRRIAKIFNETIMRSTSQLVTENIDDQWVNFMYPIILANRLQDGINYLKKNGIEAKKPLNHPLHYYKNLKWEDFPNAERLHRKLISLPLYPVLTEKEVKYISEKIINLL